MASSKNKTRKNFTSAARQQQRMENIFDWVRAVPEAARYLAQAQEDGIVFAFSDKMIGTGRKAEVFTSADGTRTVMLSPAIDGLEAASAIAHELRHTEQNRILGFRTMEDIARAETDSMTTLALMRIKEADAYSFQFCFNASYRRILGNDFDTRIMTAAQKDDIRQRVRESVEENSAFGPEDRLGHFKDVMLQLSSYDTEELERYYRRYVIEQIGPIDRTPAPGKPLLNITDFRQIIPYASSMSDRELDLRIRRHMHPDARQLTRLMDDFEKASSADKSAQMHKINAFLGPLDTFERGIKKEMPAL